MEMKLRTLFAAALLGLLAGCSQSATSAPTAFPPDYLPTAVALTGQAVFATAAAMTKAVPPTVTPLPTETLIPVTAQPTSTPTFEPGFTDFAQIRFISPGPMSSVISPLSVQVLLVAGESNVVQIDLLGEDGRVLQRGLSRVQRNLAGNYRSYDMKFEIRAVSEKGYIRISTRDDHHRIQTLNTMPLLLYSIGGEQINPVGNMIYERCRLEGLKIGQDIFGGVVNLKGRFWPFNRQAVFAELLLDDGQAISSRVLNFKGIDPQDFETTLPYKIKETTNVRLTIRQDNPELSITDPDLLKYMYVYTIALVLHP